MPIVGPGYHFNHGSIMANAPLAIGVYGLYQNGAVIYYGRAASDNSTIFHRLMDHLSGREGPCTKAAYAFNFEVTAYPFSREKDLLEEHLRLYGCLPRCNDRIG